MTMRFTRRGALMSGAGLLSCGLSVSPSRAQNGERVYTIIRAGDEIGEQRMRARKTAEELRIDISIDIAVKILGFTAYRYAHRSVETWRGGALWSIEATTDDDGEDEFCRIQRQGAPATGALKVDGSAYSGDAPAQRGADKLLELREFIRGHLDQHPVGRAAQRVSGANPRGRA